jgi:predicted MPP superfamily phosphohydrolase
LAGNELPWIAPAADLSDCPTVCDGKRPLRIGLAHTPDQIPWARASDIDLMLAGHTHGGQICPPGIGPVVNPSRFPLGKIAGAFQEGPTLLHISRGLSGTRPIRIDCPPELTKLVLNATDRA